MSDYTPELAAQLREESERIKDEPLPPGAVYTRPNSNRTRPFTIRLSPEEADELQRAADAAHLPASTMARSWIITRLDAIRSRSGNAA